MQEDTVLFVPTRGNVKRLLKTADQYATLKQVYLLITDVEGVDKLKLPVNCIPVNLGSSENFNLRDKRNLALRMARELGLSYCLQSDDDLSSRGEYSIAQVASELVDKLEQYPYLGAASSYNFSSIALGQVAHPISHEFVIKNFPSLLFALRMSAMNETKGFVLRSMEDADIGCQLWEKGWIVAGFPKLTWNHNRARKSKKPSDGGLPLTELKVTLPEGISVMEGYSAVKRISCAVDRDGFCQHKTFWNWDYFIEKMKEAGIQYADSKYRTGLP